MEFACRCCLLRPPDKDLKTTYLRHGKTEVYVDMLKECFEIHINTGPEDHPGICEVCISHLRDAFNFKQQVQKCQQDFQRLTAEMNIKEELQIKEELPDSDNELCEEWGGLLPHDAVTLETRIGRTLKLSNKVPTRTNKSRTSRSTTSLGWKAGLKDELTRHTENILKIFKHSNCTAFYNRSLKGMICACCRKTYETPRDLKEHTLMTHNSVLPQDKAIKYYNMCIKVDVTDLKCTLCDANLNFIVDLKKHLTEYHSIKFNNDVYDFLLEFKFSDNSTHQCALCSCTYETFKTLLQHMNTHYQNYVCDLCNIGFLNRRRLKSHKKSHDTGTHKCGKCEKIFDTKYKLDSHEKYSHNNTIRYRTRCPECNVTFTSYYQRNRHMTLEHGTTAANYKCNICDRSFLMRAKLTSHIKKVHLMERDHICPQCGEGFFVKQSLNDHMIRHNGDRVFKCSVCGKAYARKKTLREHMRIHNNDRRFKCGVCLVAFVQKCSLKSHMMTNHGLTLAEYETSVEKSDGAMTTT